MVALTGTAATPSTRRRRIELTFPIPDGVDDATALALLVQGTTAWHLYRTAGRLATGESVVVHAAAGGVGSLAVQLGHPLGAGRVIAVASSAREARGSRWSWAPTWRSTRPPAGSPSG